MEPSTLTRHHLPGETVREEATSILNALTVDVEDYFHVESFRDVVDSRRWQRYPLRVDESTRRLLDLFDRRNVKATFFVLGWVARRVPGLVKEIAGRGHEVACHSFWHRLIYRLTPATFRADTREATKCLEDLVGVPVTAYRAPSYSITPRSLWALEILAECGYRYDSSIFPIRHDVYGFPSFPRFPVEARTESAGTLIEFPMSTVKTLGLQLPGPGGGYLRIFPYSYSHLALRRLNRGEGRPGVVYIHPWEVDPEQPRLHGRLKSRWRHYTGIRRTEAKLDRLLRRYRFAPMGTVLQRYPKLPKIRVADLPVPPGDER